MQGQGHGGNEFARRCPENPRLGLRIIRIKIEKKVEIIVVIETGSIIGHVVAGAFKIIFEVEVAVEALVDGGQAQELGRGASGSSRAFAGPIHGRHVVSGVLGGLFADVVALGDSLLLEEAACKFEVGVIDGSSRVLKSD